MIKNTKKRQNESILILSGVFLGFVLGFVVSIFFIATKEQNLSKVFLSGDRIDWETLLGGILALIAGFGTIYMMRWQADDQRIRKALAANSMLPLLTSELIEYSENCFKYLIQAGNHVTEGAFSRESYLAAYPEPPRPPSFREEITNRLRDCIEHFDVGESHAIMLLLSTIQVHQSRINKIYNVASGANDQLMILQTNIYVSYLDTAEIYRRSERILEFSRGRTEKIEEVSINCIKTCLHWHLSLAYEHDEKLIEYSENWSPCMGAGQ